MQAWESEARWIARMPWLDFERLVSRSDPTTRADLLRARCRFDRETFCAWLWPDRFTRPLNAFQRSLLAEDKRPWTARTAPSRSAVAAPRGYAKSTIGTFAEIVHDIVHGLERFVLVIANHADLANDLVEDVRNALAEGEGARDGSPLRELYGTPALSGGRSDFTVRFPGRPSIRVRAASFGGQVRGVKHEGVRPTKVIIDDGEHSDRVRSAEQRAKTWKYIHDDILKVGDRRTVYQMRGTVLHPEAALAKLLDHPGWTSARWQAVRRWPDRLDLWERCRQSWADLRDPDRAATARAFYDANRAAMDAGAEVLDPIAEPLFDLFVMVWAEGRAAFEREKQNNPRDPSSSRFDTSRFARCAVERGPDGVHVRAADGRRVPLAQLVRVAHLDPALGKGAGVPGGQEGDFAAIAIIGRERGPDGALGYGYLLDGWLARATTDQQLAALLQLARVWGFGAVQVEANGFQALVARDLARLVAAERITLQAVPDVSKLPKDVRIGSLEVPLGHAWLQIAGHVPAAALAQFADWPDGDHDDFPDAVEGAWRFSGVQAGAQAPAMGQNRFF